MTDQSIFTDKRAAYYTLGCKLNYSETSAIAQSLLALGINTVKGDERADICLINTCSVTELANKKCRYIIRKAQREHPGAFIIVTGCYAQLNPEEVLEIEGVNLVVGSEDKLKLASYISSEALGRADYRRIVSTDIATEASFQLSASSDERTRYFLKVQDGCDYQCSYCTIPKARGRSRSSSIQAVVDKAQEIVDKGGVEIVLTGVNIGDFGRGQGEKFVDLLRGLEQVQGLERYRIGSIEPNLLTEEIIDLCGTSTCFAPHFHIPLQSGSDAVLKLMRRRYNRDLFTSRLDYIHKHIPHAFIGIDVIVGTRGERPEYFADCLSYLQQQEYAQLHVFTYSERPGTSALSIAYTVPIEERHRRSRTLQDLSDEKLKSFYHKGIGRSYRVIWEEGNYNGLMMGYSENYIRVAQPYDASALGKVSTITPQSLRQDQGLYLI